MPQNSEQIEAKLCAYIDGELDAAGRAEIEKYLQSNPQHRRLMLELAEQREVLAQLPRESAPPEILESVQGQLERSLLLDGDEDSAGGVVLRMNVWTKVFAAAAVVLLAVGLGVVVMYVIPPMGDQGGSYAIVQDDDVDEAERVPARPREPMAMRVDEPAADEVRAEREEATGIAGDVAGEVTGDVAGDATGERTGGALAEGIPPAMDDSPLVTRSGLGRDDSSDPAARPLAMTEPWHWSNLLSIGGSSIPPVGGMRRSDDPAARHRLVERMPGGEFAFNVFENVGDDGSQALFMVVETDDPARANVQLLNYFASNSITWSEVTEPMPEPLQIAQQQVVTMSRLQQVEGRLHAEAAEVRDSADREAAAEDGPAPARRAPEEGMRGGMTGEQTVETGRLLRQEEHGLREELQSDWIPPFSQADQPGQARSRSQAQTTETENLIVARGMSIKQAEELQKSLYQPHAKQRAQVIEQSAATQFRRQQMLQAPAVDGPQMGIESAYDRPEVRQEQVQDRQLMAEPEADAMHLQEPVAGDIDELASPPPATQPVTRAPAVEADESADLPHELPLEFDAAGPTDQIDVYVIIVQNALSEQAESERTEAERADPADERTVDDEPASPPAEDASPVPAEADDQLE